MIVKLSEKVVSSKQTTSLILPLWMEHALNGRRIEAVKELRTVSASARDVKEKILLSQAVNIVDNLIEGRRIVTVPIES